MKEKFIKSTFILLVGGCITKILGMLIKIVMGRCAGTEGLGLYMLILPTFSLFIGISQFGLPAALSKLVAEDKKNNKNLFFSIIPVSLAINILLIILIIILAPFIAKNFLHNSASYYGILAIALVIPFTSISGICRSYFFGKEKMVPHIISNIVEDIVRLIVIVFGARFFQNKDYSYMVCFLILSNVISEAASILVLLLFLPKTFTIKRRDLVPNHGYIKESLSIGIPNTAGRLVGSIGYFLEPIILTNVLVKIDYPISFITKEYGILSGYVMPILLLPSFFTMAISQALMPIIAREYTNGNLLSVKKKLRTGIYLSVGIGVSMLIFFMIFAKTILNIVYNTSLGINYLRFLAPVCFFQYLQAPLATSLQAMGKNKELLFINIISVLVRTLLLFLLSLLRIGIWGLILAISCNVLISTMLDTIFVRRALDD